jgi:hypothetical protein
LVAALSRRVLSGLAFQLSGLIPHPFLSDLAVAARPYQRQLAFISGSTPSPRSILEISIFLNLFRISSFGFRISGSAGPVHQPSTINHRPPFFRRAFSPEPSEIVP